jgi:hypothetical protein
MTELFLELDGDLPQGVEPGDLAALSGLVVDGRCLTPRQCRPLPSSVMALTGGSAVLDEWREQQDVLRVVDGGLDACAWLRDERPEYQWLPRLVVCRSQAVYRMVDSPGEGFRFYTPDTSAIRGYQVTDGDRPLAVALKRARELGFQKIWLHAQDAAQRGDGLDLDLLDKARQQFDDGLWISGGATRLRHLENLSRDGGVSVLVIDNGLLAQANAEVLTAALAPPPPPEIPIQFAPQPAKGEA